MHSVFFFLFIALQIWVLCAIARALLSWFPISYDTPAYRINVILIRITEPLIAPVRRIIPPMRIGGTGLDLSFMIVILVLQIILIPFFRHLSA